MQSSDIKARRAVQRNVAALRKHFNSVSNMGKAIGKLDDDSKNKIKQEYSATVDTLNELIESYEKMLEVAHDEQDEE